MWLDGRPFRGEVVKSVCWILMQKSEKVYVKTSNPKMTYGRLVCWILTQKVKRFIQNLNLVDSVCVSVSLTL